MFRISFFEFYPTHSTLVSAGNQISREEVDRLYNKKRFPQNSLQYELDLFYEKCLMNSVGTDIAYFFQTKLLTVDQYLSFKENFTKNERRRYPERLRKNKKQLRKRLMINLPIPVNAELHQKLYFDSYHDANDQIDEDFKLSSDLAEILKYNMFNGFRATWEFDLEHGKPIEEKIAETIKLNTWKLRYAESPDWDGWVQDMQKSLIKDLNLRQEAK